MKKDIHRSADVQIRHRRTATICCTLREDVLTDVAHLARQDRFDCRQRRI